MTISLDPSVPMARAQQCVTYSASAWKLMGKQGSWLKVQQRAANCLRAFNSRTGHDATAWFAAFNTRDRNNEPDILIAMYFATDVKVSPEQMASFDAPFETDPGVWTRDGMHPRHEYSFPSLHVRSAKLYQVWLDINNRLVTRQLKRGSQGIAVWDRAFPKASADDYLPNIRHAEGTFPEDNSDAKRHKDRLKLAFAMAVSQDIVAADGRIDPGEVAFMAKTFPPRRLGTYNLNDPGERAAVYAQARTELKDVLGHHEKLALLSTFFATCYADGSIDPAELVVLKTACADLGLERAEVAMQLAKLWK